MAIAIDDDEAYDAGETIDGRPDFRDHDFGVTAAKRFPPYVYSVGNGSALVHRIAAVRLHWYRVARGGHGLIRMRRPYALAQTVCGQVRWLTAVRGRAARTCVVPDPDALLCGRCHGDVATFGPGGAGTKAGITRRAAGARLGCVVRGY